MPICDRQPKFRRYQRDENKQPEESLSDAGVKDADLILHHGDAKTTQNSLQNHANDGNSSQVANPSPVVAQPKPHCENNRKKSNQRTHQTMRVLKQNSADPFRNRKQKHVIAEGGRPIRHSEADVFTRHHSAAANEQKRRDAREPRETVEPRRRPSHTGRIRRMRWMGQMQRTPYCGKNLSAWTWGRGRCRRFVLRLLRTRRCRRRKGLHATGEFSAFLQPGLVILRSIDHQRAFHSVMTETAQLGTNDFIRSGLNRREPDWN